MYIKRPLCAFSLLFVLILAALIRLWGISRSDPDTGPCGKRLEFKGTIKYIESKNDDLILHIKDIFISDETNLSGKVLMYIPDHDNISKQLHIGSRIEGYGDFEDFKKAYNRGQFDLGKYRNLSGYMYAVYNGGICGVSDSYNIIADTLYRIKVRTSGVYDRFFNADESGVVKALVLADKTDLERSVRDRYSDAGIAHILALSGLHIATIGFILIRLFEKIGLPKYACIGISALIMLSYCTMTGMPLSAIRALIMFFVSAGAMLIGRTVDLRTSASLAALLMLCACPDRLYDSSFLLSFSSILGIGLVYPCIRELVYSVIGKSGLRRLKCNDKYPVRLGMGILSSVLVSVSIQLTIAPFTMWFYYRLSTYGIVINLIVVPLVGVLLILALVIGILGNIPLLDRLTGIIAYPARMILGLYDVLTEGVNSLPGSVWVTGRPGLWQMIIYYSFLFFLVIYTAMLERKSKIMLNRIRRSEKGGMNADKLKRYLAVRSAVALAGCLSVFACTFIRIRPVFEISALYVGQGQCFVMQGSDIPTVMYDCGSSDEKDVGRYIVSPFLEYCGISHLDTVFVSHMDTDHVGGLIELLEDDHCHIRIDRIVISRDSGQKKSDNYDRLKVAARKRSVPMYTMGCGDVIRWSKLYVYGLSPIDHMTYTDTNDGSLVLSFEYRGKKNDLTALFTGDISSEVEQSLETDEKIAEGGYDYLQVAHHGSRFSSGEGFISRVSPRLAIISAGIDNRYGHPHKETLELFNGMKIPTYVTSQKGEISFAY